MEQCMAAIAAADYVALDLEFSGLFTSLKRCVDTDEYYKHARESVQRFMSLQMGICCCRRVRADAEEPSTEADGGVKAESSESDGEKGEEEDRVPANTDWILSPFNYYLFPVRRRIAAVDSTSLVFLREQGFDFNEWIDSGRDYERLASIESELIRTSPQVEITGAQRLIECIIEKEKPIILHNGFLDLLHIYDKFIGELPNTLEEFRIEATRLFSGGIYDTKRIANEKRIADRINPSGEYKTKYKADGIAGSVQHFEGEHTTAVDEPPTTYSASELTGLNKLRRALEKGLRRALRIHVEQNDTCSYELRSRAVALEEALGQRLVTPPPSKRPRTVDNKEHEAGFDAMLTSHLFLLELESLKDLKNANALTDCQLVSNARDKLVCVGVHPGFVDLRPPAVRQKIKAEAGDNTPAETSGVAPMFRTTAVKAAEPLAAERAQKNE